MSNTTAPPGSPPTSSGNSSPPAPATSSPPASNPSPPPQSPPPSSPPPSQSPPPSSPPPASAQSPPPAAHSPPPASKSSPPPKSNPSPPPSQSSSPPPQSSSSPPHSPPPAEAGSPPPAPPQSSPPPTGTPPSSQGSTPPSPESSTPPTGQFTPPPVSDGSVPSPPSQTLSPPPVSPPSDNVSPVTPSNHTPSNGTSPTSSTSKTPPSSSSSPHGPSPLAPGPSPTQNLTGYIAGGAVAGVVIVAFFVIFFVARRRKKSSAVYATQYMPPNNFPSKSELYYLNNSGPADAFYSQQHSQNGIGNSYGSQRGNMYYQGTPDSTIIGGAKSCFSYEEVMEMTNGFSRQNILGEGGFGCVYKGWLPDGRIVAVKQLKKGSGQGEREFQAEVEIISRVHHRYLVTLVGYCISESQRLLIYDFVANQTLEHHLHGKGMPVLEWSRRMKIALGAARGLAYLHEDCHPKIIHRDIKSANILLDDAFEAQVADFGLAKLTDGTNTHVSTRVMGTFGYMAPEYASSGKLTDRSDVFSFGVVLLELVTGRKPVDPTQPLGDESLVEWARPHLVHALDTGDFGELVDARLEKHYVESEMFRMIEAAAACVRHSAPKRPRMMQVARALDCESESSDLSNGVKYGQSTVYESGQYSQDITRFRRMAFGSGDSKEFDMYSGEYTSKEITPELANSWKSSDTSSGFPSGESETQAMNAHRGDGGRRFR